MQPRLQQLLLPSWMDQEFAGQSNLLVNVNSEPLGLDPNRLPKNRKETLKLLDNSFMYFKRSAFFI